MSARVLIYTKPGCHLCDVAREVVDIVCAETDNDYAEIDIWDSPSDADLYAERIPVVVVDGVEVAQFRIDPDRLRAALRVE